ESLYQKGRDFFVTLQDAANASSRLEHYINPDNTNNTTFVVNGTGNNIQQNLSCNITMNIQQNNTKNVEEIEKLINEIIENINTYYNEKETKKEKKELIEVIQNETKQ